MKINELEVNIDYFDFDEKFYQKLDATPLNHPFLISYNKKLFDEIGLDYEEAQSEEFIKFLNGELTLKNSQPYSMVYAGHQFGYFVPQLGDGRAINLGSIKNWHLQTKGSGLTRYSRQGDGRAVLRSSIREYIMSEAMFALDIPTTRALALLGSNHNVYRSYEKAEKGAVVMRASTSWIRFGTFEFFARTKDANKNLEQLSTYVIKESYPHLVGVENSVEKMFYELVDNTAILLAKWQAYGFMHGVMNTDNMSIAGVTIDYGPFAFMDYFEKHNICNHTDVEGRYSYNNQPYIAKWNLEVLADSLGKICDYQKLVKYLDTFFAQHEKAYLELMQLRLGLDKDKSGDNNITLIILLLNAMENAKIDYNCFFYELTKLDSLENIKPILDICINRDSMQEWFLEYINVIKKQNIDFKNMQKDMKSVNPKYIIKNYMLQEAIEKAESEDFKLTNDLFNIAQNPYSEHKEYERYSKSTPSSEANLQLSCSS